MHHRQKRGGKRRLRLKYGRKPFILLSVLYLGIYLQAAVNPPLRQQEKFEAKSISISSERISNTKKEQEKKVTQRDAANNRVDGDFDRKWIFPRFSDGGINRKHEKIITRIDFYSRARAFTCIEPSYSDYSTDAIVIVLMPRAKFKLLSKRRWSARQRFVPKL